MTQHSIAEGARLVGRDRRTLYKDIKRGRLTATLSATGDRQVETSELIRVYGEISVAHPPRATGDGGQDATAATVDNSWEISRLREQVSTLEARLADKQQHIEHLVQAMRLIENKQDNEKSTKHKGGWWIFGRKK